MQKMFTVYKHTFPNNKVYIGITSKKNVYRRWSHGNGYKTQSFMWKAIQKYGWENVKHEIIAKNLSKKDACTLEIQLIAQYQSNNSKYGYNVYVGGNSGRLGIPLSNEEIENIKKYTIGRPKTADEISRIKLTLSKYWTKERRKEFGKLYGGRGFNLDENTALNIYTRLCNGECRNNLANEYKVSNSAIDRIANKQYWSIRNSDDDRLNRKLPIKYIYQYTLDRKFIRCWHTFAEIHKSLGINTGTICECCNGKRDKTKGYKWKYVLVLDNGKEIIL